MKVKRRKARASTAVQQHGPRFGAALFSESLVTILAAPGRVMTDQGVWGVRSSCRLFEPHVDAQRMWMSA
jgi:hypothetical protein